ncbi:hypothetical protein BC829DRAFT_417626 [Chytridium lagenaria]|nr:hypothetical protein BC829DRAFT_417626 [Chytridium lagenaria]
MQASTHGHANADPLPSSNRLLMEVSNVKFAPGPLTRLVNGDVNPFEASFASQPISNDSHSMQQKDYSYQPYPQTNNHNSNGNNASSQPNHITIPGGISNGSPAASALSHLPSLTPPAKTPSQPSALSSRGRSQSFGTPTPSSDGSQDGDDASGSDGKALGKRKRAGREEEGEDDKRKKFLERNRVAASKCRQKKKLWMQELEQKSTELSERNKELHITVGQLKDEVLLLKNQLLLHRQCRCNMIQSFIASPQFNEFKCNSDVKGEH